MDIAIRLTERLERVIKLADEERVAEQEAQEKRVAEEKERENIDHDAVRRDVETFIAGVSGGRHGDTDIPRKEAQRLVEHHIF
jgi:hypothetical protein